MLPSPKQDADPVQFLLIRVETVENRDEINTQQQTGSHWRAFEARPGCSVITAKGVMPVKRQFWKPFFP